ncbi:MAG: hypothetical protein LLG02_02790 [Pelosinus sp.]|nr:hypothetical protein [Pelosinus sp.]
MLKLRIAICLALFVGTLTLVLGLINEARFTIIIYRTMVSFLLFGVLGLVFGSVAERFLHKFLQKLTNKGQDDIVNETELAQSQDQEAAAFSPFNPDNFEHIAQNKE